MIEMVYAIPNEATEEGEVVNHPVGLGLFSTSVYDMDANLLGCVSYYGSSDEFDGAFRAARTFGLMTFLSITIALLCVLVVTLFLEPRSMKAKLWKVARFLFFAAFLSELLTFMAFGRDLCSRSDMRCKMGTASILTLLNLFILWIQCALIYAVPPPKSPIFRLRKDRYLERNDEECANFEVLSNEPRPSQKQAKRIGRGDDAGRLSDSDLESECGTQAQSIVMEGIECVAADHLRREEERNKWQKLLNKYYRFGKKRSTR